MHIGVRTLVICFLVTYCVGVPAIDSTTDVSVRSTSGLVLGITLPEAHGFYGIPYAEQPVGDLRFSNPREVSESATPINATTNQLVVCYQTPQNCSVGRCFTNLHEDCLILSVHVPLRVDLSDPDVAPSERLPVMFWIHGGSFLIGSGMSPLYDGRWLSNATNNVIVTIKYRIGALGFLVHGLGEDAITGNFGLKDQQMAMKWVQSNIAKFGGNKDDVTIFGTSSGAQSVLFHLVSSVSKPLFRAILQSCLSVYYPTPEEAQEATNYTLAALNCSTDERQCLMNAAPERLVQIATELQAKYFREGKVEDNLEPFRPVLDGVEFTDQPIALFRDGKWNKEKDLNIGTNLEELYNNYKRFQMSKELFYQLNTYLGEETGNAVSEKYESMLPEGGENYGVVMGIETTHLLFTCPNRAVARFASAQVDRHSVFLYVSEYAPSGICCEENDSAPWRCGTAYHGSEAAVVFRTGPSFGFCSGENATSVSNQFTTYWGGFATTGDPSSGLETDLIDVPAWPPYVEAAWENIRIRPLTPLTESKHLEDICDFWDALDVYVEMKSTGSSCRPTLLFLLLSFICALTFLRQEYQPW